MNQLQRSAPSLTFLVFPQEIVEGIDVLLKGVDSENEDVDDFDVVTKNALLQKFVNFAA